MMMTMTIWAALQHCERELRGKLKTALEAPLQAHGLAQMMMMIVAMMTMIIITIIITIMTMKMPMVVRLYHGGDHNGSDYVDGIIDVVSETGW